MIGTSSTTPLIALDAVVIDTETTSLDPRNAWTVEIAAVRIAGGRLQPATVFRRLIRPRAEPRRLRARQSRCLARRRDQRPPYRARRRPRLREHFPRTACAAARGRHPHLGRGGARLPRADRRAGGASPRWLDRAGRSTEPGRRRAKAATRRQLRLSAPRLRYHAHASCVRRRRRSSARRARAIDAGADIVAVCPSVASYRRRQRRRHRHRTRSAAGAGRARRVRPRSSGRAVHEQAAGGKARRTRHRRGDLARTRRADAPSRRDRRGAHVCGSEDRWFGAFGGQIADILYEARVPCCRGGAMARNPHWRGSTATWHKRIDRWINASNPQDLRSADVFFDLRGVHGDGNLTNQIRREAFAAANGHVAFAKLVAEIAVGRQPSLGPSSEPKPEQGRVDLKQAGISAIVTAARVLAVCHHVLDRSTPGRLAGIKAANIGGDDDLDVFAEARGLLLKFVLSQQIADINEGLPPSNSVLLRRLTKRERERMRTALQSLAPIEQLTHDLLFKN